MDYIQFHWKLRISNCKILERVFLRLQKDKSEQSFKRTRKVDGKWTVSDRIRRSFIKVNNQGQWLRCWLLVLETRYVVTTLECWWPIWYIRKSATSWKKVANLSILTLIPQPLSWISHQPKVTKLTLSLISL